MPDALLTYEGANLVVTQLENLTHLLEGREVWQVIDSLDRHRLRGL